MPGEEIKLLLNSLQIANKNKDIKEVGNIYREMLSYKPTKTDNKSLQEIKNSETMGYRGRNRMRSRRYSSNRVRTPLISSNLDTGDISTFSDELLKARNEAMSKGWRDYNFGGKRYSFSGDALKDAQYNWSNRGKGSPVGIKTRDVTTVNNGNVTTINPYSGPNPQYKLTDAPSLTVDQFSKMRDNDVWAYQSRYSDPKAVNNQVYKTLYGLKDDDKLVFKGVSWDDMDSKKWKSMDSGARLNWIDVMDKALDPNNSDWRMYGKDNQLLINNTLGTSDLKKLLDMYKTDPNGFNDYMLNFKGRAWDTATEEGKANWDNMLQYYLKNQKRLNKYLNKEGILFNTANAYDAIYNDYMKSTPAKKHGGLIPRLFYINKYF